jgi:hypothetical protein
LDTTPGPEHGVVLDDAGLRAAFGIGDLAGIEGASERVVKLSARSDVVCPEHGYLLRPDSCRSCAAFDRAIERMKATPRVVPVSRAS